jgi:hypothetical protein
MASRDLVNNIALVPLQNAGNAVASPPTAAKSKILDTMGFEGVVIAVNVGAAAGIDANNYITFLLQESNTTNDVDFTNVSQTPNMLGAVPSGAADFNDQNRPMGPVYPQGLLPSGGVLPNLYTGLILNATTMANSVQRVGYIGNKRYIRTIVTFTGAPGSCFTDVVAVLGHGTFEPVTGPAPITAT